MLCALILCLNNVSIQRSLVFFKVFYNSGFTRTLCGGKWESLPGISNAFNNTGSSTARVGCCSPGTYMAQPNVNPFTQATACTSCPVGNYSGMSDDLNCPYTATTCPGTNAYAVEPASCRVPISDGNCGDSGVRYCPIKQAVDAYISSGDTGSYGPIADWDTSLVTDMSYLFRNKNNNNNISTWDVSAVKTMALSKFTQFR